MTSGDGGTPEVGRGVDRRTVAKGAAWVAPALLVGAEAPAYAASGNVVVTATSTLACVNTTNGALQLTFQVTVVGDLSITSAASIRLDVVSLTAFPTLVGGSLKASLGNPTTSGATATYPVSSAVPAGSYTLVFQVAPGAVNGNSGSSRATLTVSNVVGETVTTDNSAFIGLLKNGAPAC